MSELVREPIDGGDETRAGGRAGLGDQQISLRGHVSDEVESRLVGLDIGLGKFRAYVDAHAPAFALAPVQVEGDVGGAHRLGGHGVGLHPRYGGVHGSGDVEPGRAVQVSVVEGDGHGGTEGYGGVPGVYIPVDRGGDSGPEDHEGAVPSRVKDHDEIVPEYVLHLGVRRDEPAVVEPSGEIAEGAANDVGAPDSEAIGDDLPELYAVVRPEVEHDGAETRNLHPGALAVHCCRVPDLPVHIGEELPVRDFRSIQAGNEGFVWVPGEEYHAVDGIPVEETGHRPVVGDGHFDLYH